MSLVPAILPCSVVEILWPGLAIDCLMNMETEPFHFGPILEYSSALFQFRLRFQGTMLKGLKGARSIVIGWLKQQGSVFICVYFYFCIANYKFCGIRNLTLNFLNTKRVC